MKKERKETEFCNRYDTKGELASLHVPDIWRDLGVWTLILSIDRNRTLGSRLAT